MLLIPFWRGSSGPPSFMPSADALGKLPLGLHPAAHLFTHFLVYVPNWGCDPTVYPALCWAPGTRQMRNLCSEQEWDSHRVPNPVSGGAGLESRVFSPVLIGLPTAGVGKADLALTFPRLL